MNLMKLLRPFFFVPVVCLLLAANAPAQTNLWKYILPAQYTGTTPAIAPDGTIYQPAFDGSLLALTPEGWLIWTFKSGMEIESSPAVGNDGTIYFGSRDRKFYAVTPAGKLKWSYETG